MVCLVRPDNTGGLAKFGYIRNDGMLMCFDHTIGRDVVKKKIRFGSKVRKILLIKYFFKKRFFNFLLTTTQNIHKKTKPPFLECDLLLSVYGKIIYDSH